MSKKQLVCVTGAGGFIGSWVVKELLLRGYHVRGTARDPADGKNAHLLALDGAKERLSLCRADVLDGGSLRAAFTGCHGVFHVASPVSNDPELVPAAVEGTRNVMNAAADMGVRRVVFTSTYGAVHMNPSRSPDTLLDETCWSDYDFCKQTGNVYCCAKIMAEKTAMEEAARRGLELVVLLPPVTIGPELQQTLNVSMTHVIKYLTGVRATYPNAVAAYTDVRDVARAHVLAYERADTRGRYLCVGDVLHRAQFLQLLGELFPQYPVTSIPPSRPREQQQKLARDERSSSRGRASHVAEREQQRVPDPGPGAAGGEPPRVLLLLAGHDAQVPAAVLREHRHRAQHRRGRRPRHHPRHHPRLPRGEAAGAGRARREAGGLLRRDRRDQHRGPGDGHAHRAQPPGPPALRRQGHQHLLPGALPQDLPRRQHGASGPAQEHEGTQVRRAVPPLRRQGTARRHQGRRRAAEHRHPHLRHQAAPANHLLQIRRPERRLQERPPLRRLHQHVGGADLPARPPLRDQVQGWQATGLQPHRRRRRRKQPDDAGDDGREQADPAGQPGLLPDQAGGLRQVHGALPRHRLRQGGGEVRRRRLRQVGHPRLALQQRRLAAHRQLQPGQRRPRRHPGLRALPGAALREAIPPHPGRPAQGRHLLRRRLHRRQPQQARRRRQGAAQEERVQGGRRDGQERARRQKGHQRGGAHTFRTHALTGAQGQVPEEKCHTTQLINTHDSMHEICSSACQILRPSQLWVVVLSARQNNTSIV